MKNKGFTLIEFMILAAILLIVFNIIYHLTTGEVVGAPKSSYGINGIVETRCQNGYSFIVGRNGSVTQMLNENGGGVKC